MIIKLFLKNRKEQGGRGKGGEEGKDIFWSILKLLIIF
jgi:hypothetical protein